MSQNYSGRVTLILVVLGAALLAVFWPSIANPRTIAFNSSIPWSQKVNLKPGIDISGGTSLLYEIKQAEGTPPRPTLAEDMTRALKQRVDKQGLKNYIWRPQNPNRLEIQLPFSGENTAAAATQKNLEAARDQLEATNIRLVDVQAWVEKGPSRDPAEAARLARGNAQRQTLITQLAKAFDDQVAARTSLDAVKGNEAQTRYAKVLAELTQGNMPASDLERVFARRESRLAEMNRIKGIAASDPARAKAVDTYFAAKEALVLAGSSGSEAASDLKRELRGSGVLEFHILPNLTGDPDLLAKGGYTAWTQQLKTEGARVRPGDKFRWFEVDNPDDFKMDNRVVVYDDRKWVLGSLRPEDSLDRNTGEWKLANASAKMDNTMGTSLVGFQFDGVGGRLFGDLTSRHVNQPMAIMLDGRVISAPNINQPITGGSGTISGGGNGFTQKELSYLISMLEAGSLPGELSPEPIYERTVGPQLGEDNLIKGLTACGIGLAIVAVFLIVYYHLSGVVAFLAVAMNLIIIMGVMAALNATFTLPGIAAVVLTVGSAVDANVLIFERLREEQHRGLSIRMALRNAYDRAFSAILDSNMTTLITSFFLIAFGTEEVKGFGITLVIGILGSLFTSLYVTKTLFGILIDRFGVKELGSLPLSFPKWDKALRPNWKWTRLVYPFAGFSAIFIVAGIGLFIHYANKGEVLDIEFAGGTAVTFDIKSPQEQKVVREWMDQEARLSPDGLPSPGVVRVGTDNMTWEVTTSSTDATKVKQAVLHAVGDQLKSDRPSKFLGVGQKLDDVLNSQGGMALGAGGSIPAAVIPVTAETTADAMKASWPDKVVPDEARKYIGGAALVLRDLDPPISPKSVADRVNRQRLLGQSGGTGVAVSADYTVVGAMGPNADKPVANIILLTIDPSLDYRKEPAKWRDNVVAPLWDVTQEAISRPSQLQQVKNVNASVAGDTKKDATIALILSLVFIMAYIWMRFGNLKYGTATVVALLHDVLFVIAALGFAHLLASNAIGEALQLQPFRINLTLVAGILTIMGYSMLDTIVVFDRIREIRGKYGHVSANVINDAVNQTLSRTVLTAGTTIVSVGIMYFMGGEGIHGFTFVLFVGILAGTYSSVAIASPILLVGGKTAEETTNRNRVTPVTAS